MSLLRRLGSAVILLGAAAAPVSSQGLQIQLTPFAGGLVPMSELGPIPVAFGNGQPVTVRGEMAAGFGFGGRLMVDRGGWFGVEASLFTVRSDLRIVAGSITTGIDAQLLGGSLKAVARSRSQASGTEFQIGAGIGGVDHRGDAFRHSTDQLDLAGVGGAGLHLILTEQVTLRFDGELYLYNWSARPGFGAARQTDLVMTVGLGLRLRR